jgi:predicted phosphodiesterase
MKIALASDVHLEFGRLELFNNENADVLVLSGDICTANHLNDRDVYGIMSDNSRSNMYHTFFQECSERFPHVVYVAGNHEHYHGDYAITLPKLKEKLGYLKNLNILDKEYVTIDGVTFIGGTLWTDMNKEDPHTLYSIKGYMNDYRIIQNSNNQVHYRDSDGNFHTRTGKLTPEETVVEHKEMLAFIDKVTAEMLTQKVVVVGHHSPSKLSTKPQYENDTIVNGAYSSDLSNFILDRPCIKLWTHGHTHHFFDYMIGSTRIVCNPRGYVGYEVHPDEFNLAYIEV